MRKYAIAILLCLSLSPASGQTMPMNAATATSYAHHSIACSNGRTRASFDRGITLLFAFERLAARRAFLEAAKADPNCAMAQWGIAMSLGSNINVSIDATGEKQANAAIRRAISLSAKADDLDRAWIRAAATRYTGATNPDYAMLSRNYSKAMAKLAQRYPDDLDAATFYAESLMDLKPWALYTPAGNPVEGTQQIVTELESVLRRQPLHIGANHLYIHAVEASRNPQRALISATRLGSMSFEPALAHLVHMPAHIYMRTGDFDPASMSNEHATAHDRQYLAIASNDLEDRTYYYDHNLTMLAAAYSMEGNYAGARRAANFLRGEGAIVPALFVPLRFHRWDEILSWKQPPAAPDSEPLRIALWHFSRGMALAATNSVDTAESELRAVQSADAALHISASPGNYNSSADLLRIAENELAAKIAQARGDLPGAIARLEEAVRAQDSLNYVEPPDWYFPVREALGGALLRNQQPARAVEVFRADLDRNPRNPRSLFGLMQALKLHGDVASAQLVRTQFDLAWQHADTELTTSSLW